MDVLICMKSFNGERPNKKDFPKKRCIDSNKNNPSQSSSMIHWKCVAVSVSAETLWAVVCKPQTRLGLAIWRLWLMPDVPAYLVSHKAISNAGKEKLWR